MKVLLWGLAFFILSLILNLFIWRVHLPKRQTNALLKIFYGVFVLGIILFEASKAFNNTSYQYLPDGIPEYLHLFLLFTSLTLAYVITYSAVEVDSPSLVMVIAVNKAGRDGLSKTEFAKLLTNERLVIPRINDLVRDKLIFLGQDKYKLTLNGRLFISIFILYRKVMNAQKGG